MMSKAFLFLCCILVAGAVSAEPVQASYPLMKLKCVTVDAQNGSPFDRPSALMVIPSPFKVTISQKRLKFAKSLLAFEGGKSYQVGQPPITEADVANPSGRYGNLKARQADDDIPTGFTADGVTYELQAITGFKVKESRPDKSTVIDTKATIRVTLEAVTDTAVRGAPVWSGDCVLSNFVEEK